MTFDICDRAQEIGDMAEKAAFAEVVAQKDYSLFLAKIVNSRYYIAEGSQEPYGV